MREPASTGRPRSRSAGSSGSPRAAVGSGASAAAGGSAGSAPPMVLASVRAPDDRRPDLDDSVMGAGGSLVETFVTTLPFHPPAGQVAHARSARPPLVA